MREEVYDDGKLRKYLLGGLNEAEQHALEERLLTDDELFDLLHIAEDELVDDYLSGALSADEEDRFGGFFLSTPTRRRNLSFAMALRRYVTIDAALPQASRPTPHVVAPNSTLIGHRPPWWKRAFSAPYLKLAAAVVIILTAGLGTWRVFFDESEVDKGIAALARAYGNERPVEARISGLGYAPYPRTRGSADRAVDMVSRDRAERILLDAVVERPSPAAHHALGEFYLAERKFDEAIKQFEEASKADPNNAKLHSDYGAALFEKGRAHTSNNEQGRRMEELSRSVEQFNRALELDGDLLEALFNRALYHEYVTLYHQASEDWRLYLEKDPNSNWAAEAREHLRRLDETQTSGSRSSEVLLKDFMLAYRNNRHDEAWKIASQEREAITGKLVWWQLLEQALANRAMGEQPKEYLEALSLLGRIEFERTGDRYVSGLASFYQHSGPAALERLAQAHGLINQGHNLCLGSKYQEALTHFSHARAIFESAGNKWETGYSDYWIGYCHQRGRQAAQSRAVLEPLMRTCNDGAFLWLLAQATNKLASVMVDEHSLSRANEYSEEALRISELIEDAYGVHKNLAQLANQYKFIDDYEKSLTYMSRCLDSARSWWPGARQMWRDYETLAEVLTAMRLYGAAADYEKEALQLALNDKDPAFIHVAYAHLGFIYGKTQDYANAVKFGRLGYESVAHLANQPGKSGMLAFAAVQLGHIYMQAGVFDDALAYYDRAIGFLNALDNINIYEAHKGRMLCYMARGDDDLAKEELQVVLNFADIYRAKIYEERNRNKFFDAEQKFYDAAIDFIYVRLGDEQGAFELSETLRARSLLDMIQTPAEVSSGGGEREIKFPYASKPLKLDVLKARLPNDVQLLEYTVLDDKLLIWVVSNNGLSVQRVDIHSNELKERILNYCAIISRNPPREDERQIESKALYSILIEPVEPILDQDKQICIIPEKMLNYLPFNTLVAKDNRYLIQNHVVTFSPSANIYLRCSDEAVKKALSRSERLLSVGNPLFDREAFPLSDLPSAAKEAREITRYYNSSCLLIEGGAKKEAVKTEMRKADVVHLASHYVVNEQSPMLSKLLLTRDEDRPAHDGDTEGVLRADEVYNQKPLRARLIVLSGCQTGVERYYNGEGLIGMSRMFIASGVPLVVASLWAVDSDATAELMVRFHRYRKEPGFTTSVALSQAQRDMIAGPDPRYRWPGFWAAFIVIGGKASF